MYLRQINLLTTRPSPAFGAEPLQHTYPKSPKFQRYSKAYTVPQTTGTGPTFFLLGTLAHTLSYILFRSCILTGRMLYNSTHSAPGYPSGVCRRRLVLTVGCACAAIGSICKAYSPSTA